jgi:hypothetical protein
MAFYDTTYDDDESKDIGFQKVAEEQEQKDTAPQVQKVGGTGGEIQANSSQQLGKQETGSGTFQNLKRYVEKNKPQAQQMGQKIASDVAESYNQAKQDITQTSAMAQEDVKPFAEKYREANTKLKDIASKSNVSDQEAEYYQQFMKPENKDYTQSEGYALDEQRMADLTTKAEEEQKKLQEIGTESGRYAALKRMVEAPTYTRGQQKLDQLLLSNIGEDIVSNVQEQTGVEDINQADLIAKIASEREKAEGIYSDVYGEEGLRTQAQQVAAEQLAEQQANLQADLDARIASNEGVLKRYNEGTLTPQDYATLGLTQGQDLYGLDLGNYLQGSTTSQVATPEDLARAQALAKLAGQEQTLIADPTVVDDAGLLNQQQLAQDVEKRRNDLSQTLRNLKSYGYYDDLKGLEGKELAGKLIKDIKDFTDVGTYRFKPGTYFSNNPDDVLHRSTALEDLKTIQDLYNQYGGTSAHQADEKAIQEMARATTDNVTTGGETSIQQPAFSFNHNTGTIEALPVVSGAPIPQGMSYEERQKYIEQGRIDPTTNRWIR